MSNLHEALKALEATNYSEVPVDNLKPFLSSALSSGQLIVDSLPIPPPNAPTTLTDGQPRSNKTATSAAEIIPSSARPPPPPPDVEVLQKEWKPVKINAKDNPLEMSVYKCNGKDGKGAWFARRSVHEGLGFEKWKRGLKREFPETMKVQGGPGEGGIRGIGGERRVEYRDIEGLGKLEVYLLSAQFPGPTAPRDFVTMFLTSDRALKDQSDGRQDIPRRFIVISKPCIHPDTPQREGYIRGQYESVEFIREIVPQKKPQRASSAVNLTNVKAQNSSGSVLGKEAIVRNAQLTESPKTDGDEFQKHPSGSASEANLASSNIRQRGNTIAVDWRREYTDGDEEYKVLDNDPEAIYPVEWIMITRSNPGGSVPRFMVERATPGGIVADASLFLNWACSKDMDELDVEDEGLVEKSTKTSLTAQKDQNGHAREEHRPHNHGKDPDNSQINGHLSGTEKIVPKTVVPPQTDYSSGLYGMVAGAATAAGSMIAAHAPPIVSDHLPQHGPPDREDTESTLRRASSSSVDSVSSVGSFTSALEGPEDAQQDDGSSTKTTTSSNKARSHREKELQKLEDRKRKLDEKLTKARQKEQSKKSEDTEKEAEAMRKVEEKHSKEVKRQEERYRREVEKLEKKKEKEAQKSEQRKRKAEEKDEKTKLMRELEEVRAEVLVLRKEKEIMKGQVAELQADNTALAVKVGRMGMAGEDLLRDFKEEMGKQGRGRTGSSPTPGAAGGGSGSGSGKSPVLRPSSVLSGGTVEERVQ